MKKQEYTAPQIEVLAMDIESVMDITSITGEPTGGGSHSIVGAKSFFYIEEDDELIDE